jgi:hypothetical protein
VGWIIFLVMAITLLGVIAYVAFDESFVKIEPGTLGLLLVHGRATKRVLEPGPHWVPALRRRMVQPYPSVELSFSADGDEPRTLEPTPQERSGPRLDVNLGDRNAVVVAYTVRFRLEPESLVTVHERFGPDGIWAVVRDTSARTVRAALSAPDVGVENLVGPARRDVEQQLLDEITKALAEQGILVASFFFGDVDLGRAGEAIEAIARAQLELEREQAEAAMRLARAQIDADLAPYIAAATDAALRYREVDSWRELARAHAPGLVVPTPSRSSIADATPAVEVTPAPTPDEL